MIKRQRKAILLVALACLALLAAIPPRRKRLWPLRVISPSRLQVHLRLCVFRERAFA
ncbi:MAG: hypothetical protein LBE93_20250 [Enterobacter asburiae]|jgi:hypothetical protein|nr:hypothetical protein [Enterobacter asburiae]